MAQEDDRGPQKPGGRAKTDIMGELEYQLQRVREIGEQMDANPLCAEVGEDADVVAKAMQAGCSPLAIIIAGRAHMAADEGWTWPEWRQALVDELAFLTELVDHLDDSREALLARGLWPWAA